MNKLINALLCVVMMVMGSFSQNIDSIFSNGKNGVVYNRMSGYLVHSAEISAKCYNFIKKDNGLRYVVPFLINEDAYRRAVLTSWSFDTLVAKEVTAAELSLFPLKESVSMKPRKYVIKNNGQIFEVSSFKNLLLITDREAEAKYGNNWQEKVVDAPDAFFADYFIPDVNGYASKITCPTRREELHLLPGIRLVNGYTISNSYVSPYGISTAPKIVSYQVDYQANFWVSFLDFLFERHPVSSELGVIFKKTYPGNKEVITVLPGAGATTYYSSNFLVVEGTRKENMPDYCSILMEGRYVEEGGGEINTTAPFVCRPCDRIRGDVNGDGVADEKDVDAFLEVAYPGYGYIFDADIYAGKYNKDGINVDAMSLPGHTMATFLALTKFIDWLKKPNNDFGFGELMSKTAYQKKRTTPCSYKIKNGKLVVIAKPGDAINVFAITGDYHLFRKDSFANNVGEAIFDIPDTSLDYKVEICPINQVTGIINSSAPVSKNNISLSGGNVRVNLMEAGKTSLKVFDLRGREVATLIDGNKNAGNYLIQLKGLNKGQFVLCLQVNGNKQTMKINNL